MRPCGPSYQKSVPKSLLVRVPQSNRTNRKCIYTIIRVCVSVRAHIYMIYFEELAIPYNKFLRNMEAEKFPSSEVSKLRPERTDGVHSSPKAEDQCLS